MATAGKSAANAAVKEMIFAWEGKDKSGKIVKGELRAGRETIVNVTLRRHAVDPAAGHDDEGRRAAAAIV